MIAALLQYGIGAVAAAVIIAASLGAMRAGRARRRRRDDWSLSGRSVELLERREAADG